ncbi:MAG: response regulator transcription factor [Hyphomonas sp.]|jgi:DNA-binding NarL/FixJ family response regulator|nr:response regulator transcription factor [Hyphomonas sp.]
MGTNALDLIIADDHPVFRAGIQSIVRSALGEVRLREAGSAAVLKRKLAEAPADLLILDIFFPGLEPESDIAELRAKFPLMAILVVSMLTERGAVERLMRVGANGFVSKRSPPESMLKGIREVMEGERPVYLPPAGPGRPCATADNPVRALPPRQSDVLKLICLGLSNKEIAKELDLSVSTVRAHVSALFQKLGVTNRTAAATFGINHGALHSAHKAD